MMDLLTIALEAHSDERNHHRRYEVSVGHDLLGHWVVTIRYGRVGWPLRELRFGEPEQAAARQFVNNRLRRRLSAQRRIGCPYRIRELAVSPDVTLLDWLPATSMAALSS